MISIINDGSRPPGMGDLYLELDQDRFNRYDGGLILTGAIWENEKRTIPHDITGYERITYRYFRHSKPYYRYSTIAKPVFVDGLDVEEDDPRGKKNTWACMLDHNGLLYSGVFLVNLALETGDARKTTLTRRY